MDASASRKQGQRSLIIPSVPVRQGPPHMSVILGAFGAVPLVGEHDHGEDAEQDHPCTYDEAALTLRWVGGVCLRCVLEAPSLTSPTLTQLFICFSATRTRMRRLQACHK